MKVTIKEKDYIIEYTRGSICKAEEAFNVSMLSDEQPKNVVDLVVFLKALLFGALINNMKDLTVNKMEKVYDEFVSDDGFEQEALIEGLIKLLGEAINPTGGNRRKKFM